MTRSTQFPSGVLFFRSRIANCDFGHTIPAGIKRSAVLGKDPNWVGSGGSIRHILATLVRSLRRCKPGFAVLGEPARRMRRAHVLHAVAQRLGVPKLRRERD